MEGVHVERQIVELSVVVGDRGVGVAVKGYDAVHEIPDFLVGGVEDVRAVLVYVDPLDILAINVAAQVRAFVNHKTAFARFLGDVREGRTKEAGANDKELIIIHVCLVSHFESIDSEQFRYARKTSKKDSRN